MSRKMSDKEHIEKYGSYIEDQEIEREGWASIIVFALVFIGIGAAMTVSIFEWFIW